MITRQASTVTPPAITRAIGEGVWVIVKGTTLLCVAALAGTAIVLSVLMVERIVSLVM
jgi:hypothetical protein